MGRGSLGLSMAVVSMAFAVGHSSIAAQTDAAGVLSTARLLGEVGQWELSERYAGDPVAYRRTQTCRMFPGGAHLICDSQGETPLGPSQGLSVTSFDPTTRAYSVYTINNVGLAVLAVSQAVNDSTLVGSTTFAFNGESLQARVTTIQDSPQSWTYRMEASIGGGPSITILDARGTRVRP